MGKRKANECGLVFSVDLTVRDLVGRPGWLILTEDRLVVIPVFHIGIDLVEARDTAVGKLVWVEYNNHGNIYGIDNDPF